MSATELEAKRWQAAVDAALGNNDLDVLIMPSDAKEGDVLVTLQYRRHTEESIALWQSLDGRSLNIGLRCLASEWREMLADAFKGAAC